jgi:protocatechuate 3,4-dioxygenase beta subunit
MKALLAVLLLVALIGRSEGATSCPPTNPDSLGPFYTPNAPVRSILGNGYVLEGTVRSSVDCRSIPEARIEVWQAGPDGKYTDAYRATLTSDPQGQYRLQTERPPRYSSWRPPHIHIQVTAPGYKILITQHYPEKEASAATFDLVLVPGTE